MPKLTKAQKIMLLQISDPRYRGETPRAWRSILARLTDAGLAEYRGPIPTESTSWRITDAGRAALEQS